MLLSSNAVVLLLSLINESDRATVQYIDFQFFFLISQDQDLTYFISAKALTHSVSWTSVLQQLRNQTQQHLSSLRLESELEPHCSLLKLFTKRLNKWELFNVFNFLHLFQLYLSSKT